LKPKKRKEKKTMPPITTEASVHSDNEQEAQEARVAIKLPGKHKQKRTGTFTPSNEPPPKNQSRSDSKKEAPQAGVSIKSSENPRKQNKKQLHTSEEASILFRH
jgi:hypothetical protein